MYFNLLNFNYVLRKLFLINWDIKCLNWHNRFKSIITYFIIQNEKYERRDMCHSQFGKKIEDGLERVAIAHVNSASGLCLYNPKIPHVLEDVVLKHEVNNNSTLKNED